MLENKTIIPAYYLPETLDNKVNAYTPMVFRQENSLVSMQTPVLIAELLTNTIANLRKAREEYLIHQPVLEILNSIDKTLALWCRSDYQPRIQALELLPTITGFSSQMIAATLDGLINMFRGTKLIKLLREELTDPLFLDEFRSRFAAPGMSRAYGPGLITAVFAGNVPGLPIGNIIYALLTKSAILGKSSSAEPLFGSLFARSIEEVNPQLAQCIAMVSWKGGDEEIEKQVFGASDAVIVYGSEHSVNEVRKSVPSDVRLITYGHKLSFGVIGRESLTKKTVKKTAEKAARDVSVFDQQGCLSPHVFYAEKGGEISPAEFARFLADKMDTLVKILPRSKVSISESSQIVQLRGTYELKEAVDDGITIYASGEGTDWTVIYERDPEFVPSCLNRVIRVKPVKDVSEVPALIKHIKGYLQTVGAALPKNRLIKFADEMGKLGADRISPLGKMTSPPLFWHHDGRHNLLDLIRWTDIEE